MKFLRGAVRSVLLSLLSILRPQAISPATELKPIEMVVPDGPLDQRSIPDLPEWFQEKFDLGIRDDAWSAPRKVDPEVRRLHAIAFAAWCEQEEIKWAKVFAGERSAGKEKQCQPLS